MTALTLNISINKIQSLASSIVPRFTPYFFVRQNDRPSPTIFGNPSIRINNQMTPFLSNFPSNAKLGFWSISQLSKTSLSKKTLENSIIINPYKTESLVIEALKKGVTRMLVSDIEEVMKIQRNYFQLKREQPKIKEPQFIWSIEDMQSDLQNLKILEKCSLPFSGVYFGAQASMKQIGLFLENDKIKNKRLLKYKQTSMEHLDLNGKAMKELSVDPMITNYSQIEDYVMVCRVLGKDRSGKAVFDESCSEFICKNSACTCLSPQTKVIEYFDASGFEWAIVKPTRLDKLAKEHIYE